MIFLPEIILTGLHLLTVLIMRYMEDFKENAVK